MPRATPLDADLSGRQLGDYRLLRRLGKGGMAEVYLAEQTSLGRQVALKVLRASLASDETFVKRFHMEARAAASLVHANIVQIHEVGCVEGVHYIAQEYVQGQNLRELLAREGPLEARLALKILRQVAWALERAAAKRIVHRDIKPENIMLARTGEVKVADFGLARLTTGEDALHLTQVGQTMGTPLYMSPEQVEGRALDPRSDIYSLGVTCYQMLAGHPPFRGETALSVAVQHLHSEPPRLDNLRPDLPQELCRIVHRMLAKDPAKRYASARELLRDLRNVPLEGAEDAVGDELDEFDRLDDTLPPGRGDPTEQLERVMRTAAMRRTRRARRWPWVAATLLAFLAGGAIAWVNRPGSLLADVRHSPPPVPKQASAQAQFMYAAIFGTQEAWQAVIDHYPQDPGYVPLAQMELALIYLGQGVTGEDDAMRIFNELAQRDDSDEFRAFGMGGQAVVLSLRKRHEESAQKLNELKVLLYPVDSGTPPPRLDPRMARMVHDIARENDRVLMLETRWTELLRDRFGE